MRRVLGEKKNGLLFVVSAPAGTGKTTLVRMLAKEFSCITESISYTTRAPRGVEVNGIDYHFVDEANFRLKLANQEFLESAKVFDHFYGTSRHFVESQCQSGQHVVLVIDTQGALELMKQLSAIFIFISPPSLSELRTRLSGRASDSKESIEKRLAWAEREMMLAPLYTYHIINDHLSVAYDVLRSIFIAEEHKNR